MRNFVGFFSPFGPLISFDSHRQASEWQKTLELLCASKDTKVARIWWCFFIKITHDSKDVQSWGNGMMVCVLKYLGRTMHQFFHSFEGKNTFVFLDVWCNPFFLLHVCFLHFFCISAPVLDNPGPLCMVTIVADHWLSQVHFGEEVGARDVSCLTSCSIGSSQSNQIVVEYFLCVSNYTWRYWMFGVKFPSNTTLYYIYLFIWAILLYIPITYMYMNYSQKISEVDERISETLRYLPWFFLAGCIMVSLAPGGHVTDRGI